MFINAKSAFKMDFTKRKKIINRILNNGINRMYIQVN